MKTIFLTGATGFLGRYLVREFQAKGYRILALVRPASRHKVERHQDETFHGVTWIEGELETLTESLSEESRAQLKDVTDIVHAAAVYDLALPESAQYGANVLGTHEMIRLANTLPKLETFHHISTLAVAGEAPEHDPLSQITEEQFEVGQTFPDGYSATKYAAEGVVRQSDATYAKKVYRLGILVGDSQTGYMPKTDGLYYVLKFLLQRESLVRNVIGRMRLLPFPYSESAKIFLIAVDVAARAIAAGFDAPLRRSEALRTFHIVGEGQQVRDVLDSMLSFLGLDLRLVPLPRTKVNDVVEKLGIPKEALHYLYQMPRITNRRFAKDFPDVAMPRFEEYANVLYRCARETWAEPDQGGQT